LALKQLLLAPNQVVDPNLKAASLHEVKKIWKFDCIQHWSTKWLLAPAF
jgi:hypothetical protein